MSVAIQTIGRIRIKPKLRKIHRIRKKGEENILRDVSDYDFYLALAALGGR